MIIGRPSIVSLTYEPSTGLLVCVSTGGPASQVKWNRKGAQYQESQQMIDGKSATYHNLLSINSSNLTDHSGTFNCTVSNVRGTNTAAKTYKCELTQIYDGVLTATYFTSIAIELISQEIYILGSRAEIVCYSNLTVQSIMLLNESSGQVLMSASNRSLILQIDNVKIDYNNSRISCDINITLSKNETVKDKKSFIFIVSQSGKLSSRY